jgi:hypothetical protein
MIVTIFLNFIKRLNPELFKVESSNLETKIQHPELDVEMVEMVEMVEIKSTFSQFDANDFDSDSESVSDITGRDVHIVVGRELLPKSLLKGIIDLLYEFQLVLFPDIVISTAWNIMKQNKRSLLETLEKTLLMMSDKIKNNDFVNSLIQNQRSFDHDSRYSKYIVFIEMKCSSQSLALRRKYKQLQVLTK